MADVTSAPWDGSSSRFTIEQWRRSCLVDRGGDPATKENYSLPVREPDGTLNRNAVHNAAARINQLTGVPAGKLAAAARALIRVYDGLGETAPDHLHQLAGRSDDRGTGRPPRRVDDDSVAALTGERMYTPARVELRSAGNGREIGGYAAVFNKLSRPMPFGRERVAPGFFNEEQRAGWPGLGAGVVCRFNHSDDFLLGTTRAGTLRLHTDSHGLAYSADLPESRNDVRELAARGDLNGSSFTFALAPDGCEWSYGDGGPLRTLTMGTLIDTAPVSAVAAYPDATVGLRSLADWVGAPLQDVIERARRHELRGLFVRTDRPSMTGAQAYAAVGQQRRLTGAQAYAAVQRKLDTLRGAEALARLRLRGRDALELHARKGY